MNNPQTTQTTNRFQLSRGNMAKIHPPTDPAEVARQAYERRQAGKNPANWGVNRSALDLPANAEIDYQAVSRAAVERARRYDVFERMRFHHAPKLSEEGYNAVRRLQDRLSVLHRTQGASDAIRSAAKGSSGIAAIITEDFSAARVQAGVEIRAALEGMTKPWRAKLIRELCEAGTVSGGEPNWHAVVKRHTGEMDRAKRGKLVRDCCDDLAESWKALDNQPGRARA